MKTDAALKREKEKSRYSDTLGLVDLIGWLEQGNQRDQGDLGDQGDQGHKDDQGDNCGQGDQIDKDEEDTSQVTCALQDDQGHQGGQV